MAWPGGSLSPGLLPPFGCLLLRQSAGSLPSTSVPCPGFIASSWFLVTLCCYLVDLFLDLSPSWSMCFETRQRGWEENEQMNGGGGGGGWRRLAQRRASWGRLSEGGGSVPGVGGRWVL